MPLSIFGTVNVCTFLRWWSAKQISVCLHRSQLQRHQAQDVLNYIQLWALFLNKICFGCKCLQPNDYTISFSAHMILSFVTTTRLNIISSKAMEYSCRSWVSWICCPKRNTNPQQRREKKSNQLRINLLTHTKFVWDPWFFACQKTSNLADFLRKSTLPIPIWYFFKRFLWMFACTANGETNTILFRSIVISL